jgi:hypothetical protein
MIKNIKMVEVRQSTKRKEDGIISIITKYGAAPCEDASKNRAFDGLRSICFIKGHRDDGYEPDTIIQPQDDGDDDKWIFTKVWAKTFCQPIQVKPVKDAEDQSDQCIKIPTLQKVLQ